MYDNTFSNYITIDFTLKSYNENNADILIAILSLYGFDSFSITQNGIITSIEDSKFDKSKIEEILKLLPEGFGKVTYAISYEDNKLLNKEWLDYNSPIIINNLCSISSLKHTEKPNLKYNIVIKSDNAFGTGNHKTTLLMIENILKFDLDDKKVLDMGCGSGVLAILASLMDADIVWAIDNNKIAIKNCNENIIFNNCDNIINIEGGVEVIPDKLFDVILSNINRNTVIDQIPYFAKQLSTGGLLLLSGFYMDDISAVEQKANANDLFIKEYSEKGDRVSVIFTEKHQ